MYTQLLFPCSVEQCMAQHVNTELLSLDRVLVQKGKGCFHEQMHGMPVDRPEKLDVSNRTSLELSNFNSILIWGCF